MHMTGTGRLGRDAELRHTPSGQVVANFAIAFNYGMKGQDGKRPSQWVDCALWGKRAEALIDYLVKGQQVTVVLEDPHIETYQGRNGDGHKLVGNVIAIELVGAKPEGQQGGGQQQRQQSAPAQRQAPAQRAPAGGDMDDDIPFAPMASGRAWAVM